MNDEALLEAKADEAITTYLSHWSPDQVAVRAQVRIVMDALNTASYELQP